MEEKVSKTPDINRAIALQMKQSKKIKISGLKSHDAIAVGIDAEIELTVEGEAGDYFGALNSGAIVKLNGNGGRFVGDSMTGGGIIVTGFIGGGAGDYMKGGIIVVKGNVKGACGRMMAGGVIIVDGNVGDNVGLNMCGGDIIVIGDAAGAIGNYMTGGRIYIGGEHASLGLNTTITDLDMQDVNLLDTYFNHYGISSHSTIFKKIVPTSATPFSDELENVDDSHKGDRL